MGGAGQSDHEQRIETELHWCFTYEENGISCAGASGRKLRQVCVWCPNYRKGEKKENEKGD
ncbi:MAG: hypothetical protein IKE81_09205 [Clostridia bacterium]|nr:hypothetical protein [Clostridia bacterium]